MARSSSTTPNQSIKPKLRGLYPPSKCRTSGLLQVDTGQNLSFEVSGAIDGKPVLVLHGGPGGGSDDELRQFFDASLYKIVTFDQRGTGKSTPLAMGAGDVDHNTTWDIVAPLLMMGPFDQRGTGKTTPLAIGTGDVDHNTTWDIVAWYGQEHTPRDWHRDIVADIEKLRTHLGIARWQVFGGSWGSTLALAYATTHPLTVTELVLRGVCLWRERDLAFACGGGSSMVYPKEWRKLVKRIPEGERNDIPKAYYTRMMSNSLSQQQKLRFARSWNAWGAEISLLRPDLEDTAPPPSADHEISAVLLETHYLVHRGFFAADGWLLREENVAKIRHIPTVIVHGRYDLVCPLVGAYDLHMALPRAAYFVVPGAGHSCWEDGIVDRLVRTTEKFGRRAAREKKRNLKRICRESKEEEVT